jgi:type II secretory pathway pseudopilin PulG
MVTQRQSGSTIVLVLVLVAILSVGLLAAVPVWETQVKREAEEELIFRGTQIVESIRLYQKKNPGRFPASLEELYKKRFLRRLYKDPMTRAGRWDIIVQNDAFPQRGTASPMGGSAAAPRATSQIMIVPEGSLAAVGTPRIIGVVSPSTRASIRIFNDQESYDQWFFYLGQDPKKIPDVVYYDQRDKK